MICIQELMTEIAEVNIKSQNVQEIIPKILCEVIEQVPLKYLHKTESIEHIANIISDVITDVSNINKNQIIEVLAKRTTMKKKEIAEILEAFIHKTDEKLEEMKRSERNEKSTDRSETTGKSSEFSQPSSSTTGKSKRKKPSTDRPSLSERTVEGKKTSVTDQSTKTTSKQSTKRSSITEKSIQKKPSTERTSITEKSLQKKQSTERSDK